MTAPQASDDTPLSRITVSGHQVELSDALRERVGTRLAGVAAKYFGGVESVAFTFSRPGKGGFGCRIRIHAQRGQHFDGEAENADAYLAFDLALDHVAKQLRRRKRVLKEDKPTNPAKEGGLP